MPESIKSFFFDFFGLGPFDQAFVLPCRVESLDELEAAMIDLYKPRYNIKLKAPTPTITPLTLRINGMSIPFNHHPSTPRFERRI